MPAPVGPIITAVLQDQLTSVTLANAVSYGNNMTVSGLSKVTVQVAGFTGGIVQVKGTVDDKNFQPLAATNLQSTVNYNNIVADGLYRVDVEGLSQIRAEINGAHNMDIVAIGVSHA